MSRKIPKNVRFRADQIAALEAMEGNEVDFSQLVRQAVDLLLSTRAKSRHGTARVAEEPATTFHHTLTPPERRKVRYQKTKAAAAGRKSKASAQ